LENNKQQTMNSDVIESVLNEILNDQKETLKLNKQLVRNIENLAGKLECFEKAMNIQSKIASTDDIKIHEIIREGTEDIKQIVASQQSNIIPEKRIMIFPEFKSSECYKLLFNCIPYLTIATYSFLIIRLIVDHWFR
jgi:hypothetical protein